VWNHRRWPQRPSSAARAYGPVQHLLEFFKRLPTSDKQLVVRPGSAHAGTQEKNHATVLHGIHAFWSQPEPVYRAV
jgi:alpha-beta hydrolase superfamily lysophospholipase